MLQFQYTRAHNRAYDECRPISMLFNQFGYSTSSVLFTLGNTKVLCSATLQMGVPPFLKGKKKGWLTAEYAMLPTATHMRSQRESVSCQKNGRAIEIARLIGRSLRTIVDLTVLGERTIIIDCDVLQADGGTRTACIAAASLVLEKAEQQWLQEKIIMQPILKNTIAAVSVGLLHGHCLLDLDFHEDSMVDADYNFVLTREGSIIEIQGTAEQSPLLWDQFMTMTQIARQGAVQLFQKCDMLHTKDVRSLPDQKASSKESAPLFSLHNRNLSPRL